MFPSFFLSLSFICRRAGLLNKQNEEPRKQYKYFYDFFLHSA